MSKTHHARPARNKSRNPVGLGAIKGCKKDYLGQIARHQASLGAFNFAEQVDEYEDVAPAPLSRKRRLGIVSVAKQTETSYNVELDARSQHEARLAALQDEMVLVRGGIWESIDRLNDLVFDITEAGHRSMDVIYELDALLGKADNILRIRRRPTKDRPWERASIAA